MTVELNETERAIMLDPCACGHEFQDHGSLACWGDDGGCECPMTFEALLLARVARIVSARMAAT